jgi:large subunit ribosomal protein L28
MAMKCMNCGKGVMYGHNVSHAKNRTNRVFKPNLHWARIPMGQIMKRVKLCTKCLRMIKRTLKENVAETTAAVQPTA